jgi:release factor glutamine methyltransferase
VTGREAVAAAERALARAGVPTPRVDSELLAAHALGVSRTGLYADGRGSLTPEEEARLRRLVERREAREPLAYILGEWGFRRLLLLVDPHVLVPRPETEIVVERCLVRLERIAKPRVLDIGTGSGAIALAIADEHRGARVVATDISAGALALAAQNRARCGLDGRVELVHGNLSAHLPGPFDLVVSNPPYVSPEEFETLEPEIRVYEPREALVGVRTHAAIARRARELLQPEGWLVFECGDTQGGEVCTTLGELGYVSIATAPDLAGRERVVEGRAPS